MESLMNSEAVKPPSLVHNNSDLTIYACYLAGGYERWLDVEELYLKAFELAPARLSWRTRPDLPDYKKCAKALAEVEDPKRSERVGLLQKQGKYMRKLSANGFAWCKKYESVLESLYKGGVVPTAAVQEASRMIRNLEKTEAFKKFSKTGNLESPLWELAEAFQCMVDSDDGVWVGRFDQMTVLAQNNKRVDVLQFIELSRQKVLKDADAENSHD